MRKKLCATFVLILTLLGSIYAQQSVVTGTVTSDADGLSMPGVAVLVKGTTIGTITDDKGNFRFSVPRDAKLLEFSFIGMKTLEIPIDGKTSFKIQMQVETIGIEDVVVTALGIKRETKALGFAVQDVGSKDLSASRELNVSNFLTGKVAGVQISKTSSGTGGSSSITIRGAKSLLGNNQPLFVVDGVPITNLGHSEGGTFGGQDLGDGIGDINPEDVESMSVLKGPSATALYGARGSNGVVLITTKSGKKSSGIGVEINSNTSIETLSMFPTFQNYYATGYEETNLYGSLIDVHGDGIKYETMDTWHGDSWGPPMDGSRTIVDPFVYPADAFKKTLVLLPQPANNVRDFYETGFNTANTVSISGNSDKTTARLSIGNSTNKGILPNWKMSKQTVVLSANSRLSDYLSFDGKINYIHDEGDQRPTLGAGSENVTRTFATLGRYVPMGWLKEYYETTKMAGSWPGVSYNPYYVVNELKNHDTKDRIIGQISATLKLASWLTLLGRTGTDFYTQKQEQLWPVGSQGGNNNKGRVFNSVRNVKDINADVILTANKEISNKISMSGSIGSSILYQERSFMTLDSRNFKAAGVYDVSNAQDIRPETFLSRKQMESVYLTGQISYANYLFLDVTGRNDWSSALGRDNYSFFYPSVSSSFVFTDLFKSIPANFLSFGKLRGSWAQVGNDSEPYLTKNGYILTTTTYAGQGIAWMNNTIPLFNLKNELTESWEVGSNLRFLNNRIDLDFTYYNGKTTNQILPVNVSNASGYTTKLINAGEIQNKGIEVSLTLKPVKTRGGFAWDINANFSKNQSKVVSLAPGIQSLTLADVSPNITEARVGQAYGNIVGYAYKRAPDGQRIVSSAGEYVPTDAQQVLGNTTPDWIAGLNNTFSYKAFTFNILLDFVQGNEMTSLTKYQMEAKGTGNWTTEGRRLHDIDPATGQQTPLVGILAGVNEITDAGGNVTYVKNQTAVNGQSYWATRAWGEIGEEFVVDGSFICLREIMLSYNFKPSMLKRTPFTGITVSAVGRNLVYLEEHMQGMGISPESSPNTSASFAGTETMSMPSTRTWAFNLKLNF